MALAIIFTALGIPISALARFIGLLAVWIAITAELAALI